MLIVAFSCVSIHAQQAIFKHYTTENGLPHDITYQIIQDIEGYIWIGTDDGLTKFNGSTFKNYSYEHGLKSNYVIDIIENKEKNTFHLATWGKGLHSFKNDSIQKEILFDDNYSKINKLYQLNDSLIYAATGTAKLLMYNTKSKKVMPYVLFKKGKQIGLIKHNNIKNKKLLIDVNQTFIKDTLYIYSSELNNSRNTAIKGVFYLNNFKLTKLNIPLISDINIHALAKTNNYTIVSSYNNLFIFNDKKLVYQNSITLPKGKIIKITAFNNLVYFIHINQTNGNRELYRFNHENNRLLNISKQLNIQSAISDFRFDNNQNLWITTYGQGVYQVLNTQNTFYGENFFKNADLRDLICTPNDVLTIAPNIIYSIKDEQISSKKIPYHTELFQLKSKDSLLLIQPNNYEYTYHNQFNQYKLYNRNTKTFKFYKNDTLLTINNFILKAFAQKNVILEKQIHHEIGTNIQHAVLHDNIILGLFGRLGIYSINTTNFSIEHWSEKHNINAEIFLDLVVQNDIIWIGTNKGLYKLQKDKLALFTTKNGLLNNHINDLFLDKNNKLWIANQKGLNVYYNNTFYTIDANLGQLSNSVKRIAAQNNSIYAVGNKGLFKYANNSSLELKNHTVLKVKQNKHVFTLDYINYINPNTSEIQYKLNAEKWTTTNDKLLNFKNLKQNNYTIQFRYKNGLSNWKQTKTYYFDIRLPWFQQAWFYILLILLVAVISVYSIYTKLKLSREKNRIFKQTLTEREQLQEELKNVRHQIAQDFHDDLGNKLANISILSNLSLHKVAKEAPLFKNIEQINKDANFLYSGMRDFVWSLDYNNNNLNEVIIYLHDFGEKLFEYTDIEFISTNNHIDRNLFLPHYWNKQLVLVFKEAMTNTLKHSKASKVYFSVSLTNNILSIQLKDNGTGIDFNNLKRKNGLNNMQNRIKAIQGKLIFENYKGFSVLFKGQIQ